jgi:hypothetical protein
VSAFDEQGADAECFAQGPVGFACVNEFVTRLENALEATVNGEIGGGCGDFGEFRADFDERVFGEARVRVRERTVTFEESLQTEKNLFSVSSFTFLFFAHFYN